MENKDMLEEKCGLCDEDFKEGEMYDDFGSKFGDEQCHYYVHVECYRKEMEVYRHSKWNIENKN